MVVVRGAAAARARRGPALGNFVLMMGEDKVPAACMGGDPVTTLHGGDPGTPRQPFHTFSNPWLLDH